MKILLLCLTLLLITGVRGNLEQQEQQPQEDAQPVIFKFLKEAIDMTFDIKRQVEDSEIAKEYKIKEKLRAVVHNAKEIESKVEDEFDKVWKKFETIGQKFPVFTEKVQPVLEDFADFLEEKANEDATQLYRFGTESFYGMKNHLGNFLKKFETMIEESCHELRSKIDELKTKVQPYMDDVRAEYKKYLESI